MRSLVLVIGAKKLFLIEGCWSNEENDAKDADTHEVELGEEVFLEISLRAIYGGRTLQKMRVHGKVGKHQMTFLVDSGSTYNFLSNKVVKKAGVNPTGYGKFEVSVANGETLTSVGLCKGVCMLIQGVPIIVDLYLLPLKGCDAVLGAQWLRTLGPIVWDFSKLQMAFNVGGQDVVLKGVPPSTTKKLKVNVMFGKRWRKIKMEIFPKSIPLISVFRMSTLRTRFSMGEGMSHA